MKARYVLIGAVCTVLACVSSLQATVVIETVPVGNTGNANDEHGVGFGGVDYKYNIGKFEVTAEQYTEFLNAVAATDTYGLYNSGMDSSTYGCQITQLGSSGSYEYDFSGRPSGTQADWEDRPVNYVSWGDAARFANWLHNDQPTGAQNANSTEDGAYFLDGATSDAELLAVSRESDWKWAITSEDEWYKAAYYNPATNSYYDYPTSSDSTPSNDLIDPDPGNNANFSQSGYTIDSPYYRTEVGEFENSDSPYGTFDMGGNVWEWNEAVNGSYRGLRGGSFYNYDGDLRASDRFSYFPAYDESSLYGFRVSAVPEPATMALLALGGLAMLRRRKGVRG